MGSVLSRSERFESAVSICLLVVLVLIGVGVFLEQFDMDMSRFGIETTTKLIPQKSEVSQKEEIALETFLPAEFKMLSEIKLYTAENLYEKINGKAPLYIESGFEKLLTRRFMSKDNETLVMELYLYDMGNVRNAFSVYSVQRRADADALLALLPSYAYRTSNALYLAHGKYYIELVGFSESDELSEAIAATAQEIRANLAIKDNGGMAELALFDRKNLVLGSIKLYLANAFGFEGFTDTFAAQYRFGDETITAFLSKCSTPIEALKVFEEYHKFLLNNGGTDIPTANPQAKFVDFYGTRQIVSVRGPFVFGIHEAENQQLAKKVEKMILNKLIEAAKTANND